MTKNIRVTDVNGKELGFTYPKRAQGLIKNGRAERVDDCTIRLSMPKPDLISEAKQMKYILLNPRDWSNNKGVEHTFMDGFEGKLEEIIQLGTWDTECVASSKHFLLEPETEYSFVFWLNGGENDRQNEVCDLLISFNLLDGYTNRYKLNRNFIKPLLRFRGWELYSIPFETPMDEDAIDVHFSFKSCRAPMAVKTAKEPFYYESWEEELDEFINARPQRHNIVFEDGWPSIHMYGGDRYSTEYLRMKNAKAKAFEQELKRKPSFSKGNMKKKSKPSYSLDDLQDRFEDIIEDYEECLHDLSMNEKAYEHAIKRCEKNGFDGILSYLKPHIGSMIGSGKGILSSIDLNRFKEDVLRANSQMDMDRLNDYLEVAEGLVLDARNLLDDMENQIDCYNNEIDEQEDLELEED